MVGVIVHSVTEHQYSLFAVTFQDLVKVHKNLLLEIQDSIHHRSAQNLYQIFITFKERSVPQPMLQLFLYCLFCFLVAENKLFSRLLIYGKYCSHVETAIATLDDICKNREDVRMKLEV